MMNAELKKGVSKNNNKEYYAIEIEITPDYKKVVFLDSAEVALVKMAYEN